MKICYSITPGEGKQVKISSKYALSLRYCESPRKYCLQKNLVVILQKNLVKNQPIDL